MAPAGLKLRELHRGRAAVQPSHRHAHFAVDERRDAREIALDGTAAVVEDTAGLPDGCERLRAGVERAGPRGTPRDILCAKIRILFRSQVRFITCSFQPKFGHKRTCIQQQQMS